MSNEIYQFNTTNSITDAEIIEQLGVRAARVLELTQVGAPIVPGFIMSNSLLNNLFAESKVDTKFFARHLIEIEKNSGKKFGDKENPLLVKVVESPMLNLVNTLSTIHNIGLSESTVDGFGAKVGEKFAWREFANLIRRLITVRLTGFVDDADRAQLKKYASALAKCEKKSDIKSVIDKNRSLLPEGIYTDVHEQLMYTVGLFHSLFSNSDSRRDSCLMIQGMVFGNYGEKSGFGNFYTRNNVTGDSGIYGHYYKNKFDARSSSGIDIEKIEPAVLSKLKNIANNLEATFKEIRNVRFTIEGGQLWTIDQNKVDGKSAQVEIKTLLDLEKKNKVDKKYVVQAIKPAQVAEILHPALNVNSVSSYKKIKGGIAGAVGAATGRVYFNTERLITAHRQALRADDDANFILAMSSTFAEDVKGIEVGVAVLSSEGGYASHAPVVARSLGKVAMVYPGIKFGANWMEIDGTKVKEGDYITINVPYSGSPIIYVGKGTLITPTLESSGLLDFLSIVQEAITDFDVRANADQPKDAEMALDFRATGIGLCRTEHMFFNAKRINIFRSMIIANNAKERKTALEKLGKMQVNDFYSLFKIMEGKPVTIRLLDAPLHEFLPHTKDSMDEFIKIYQKQNPKISAHDIRLRCDVLEEVNPMLGHRGIRVAITYPEIYHMQVQAIFEAAYKLQNEGIKACVEIMVPIVMSASEIKTIRGGKKIEGKSIVGFHEIEESVRHKMQIQHKIDYTVGTMIELPAAALQADMIARYAEFFSFGTNDLTQTTNGLSRDDFNNFFSEYNEFDLLESNPFRNLGMQIKEMISIASERGRIIRPDLKLGLCGEHGAEPDNIPFAKDAGLTYVSCSPYGIPIAKLAIAQMNINNGVVDGNLKPTGK